MYGLDVSILCDLEECVASHVEALVEPVGTRPPSLLEGYRVVGAEDSHVVAFLLLDLLGEEVIRTDLGVRGDPFLV